jgi:hypothetical protein
VVRQRVYVIVMLWAVEVGSVEDSPSPVGRFDTRAVDLKYNF